jgi:hypothetical protein
MKLICVIIYAFYGLKFLVDTNIFLVLYPPLPLEVSWLRHWLHPS